MKSYSRVLLKLSGEILLGNQPFGIDQQACLEVAYALKRLHETGLEIAVVIGGGNIFRGLQLKSLGMARTPADQMGMLATLLNGIALEQALHTAGVEATVMSALECPKAVETYNWQKALNYLSSGKIVIFVGGTGNPYFTTDTAAAMRAGEIHADILIKATKVDGIYTSDPIKNPDAKKYKTLSFEQILAEKLQVMDATAIALCQSNRVPLYVFNMKRLFQEDLEGLLTDFSEGTYVE